VENGSLEDWLRKSWGKTHSALKWKNQLFVTALQTAEAMQYVRRRIPYILVRPSTHLLFAGTCTTSGTGARTRARGANASSTGT
jgi:hypothetical protein